MKSIGLYIHFPFCKQKCNYCDFPSYAGKEDLMPSYIDALLMEIESYKNIKKDYRINTIFMGGGTPTVFDTSSLVKVLDKVKEVLEVDINAEVSIECNPGTICKEALTDLRLGGFNRLSVGLQATQDHLLKLLGRIHTYQQFLSTVSWAKDAGFDNINADIIFAIPGQTLADWLLTLENVTKCNVTHISAYSLIIEEGTPFYNWHKSGKIELVDDGLEREMYHKGKKLLEEHGYKQYEISNFAKAGYECKHNLNYWVDGEYLGLGSSAHSYIYNIRSSNVRSVGEYIYRINNGQALLDYKENIYRDSAIFETLMLGFRLNRGIIKEGFYQKFGFELREKYSKELDELITKGLITENNIAYIPTSLGFDFQNQIALAFMD